MRNALCCVGVCAVAGCLFGQGSGIQGVISDEAGQLVAGARVIASGVGPGGGRSYLALSGTSGQYSFTQVPVGNYAICVQGPRSGSSPVDQSASPLVHYLDTCYWSGPTQASVVAGQVGANVNIRLVKGAAVHVRLNDPGQYLARGQGVVLAGVVGSSSRFIPLAVTSSDPSGRTLELAIPLNAALRLQVHSGRLQLTDGSGAALPSIAASFPIVQTAAQRDSLLTFNVVGKRP